MPPVPTMRILLLLTVMLSVRNWKTLVAKSYWKRPSFIYPSTMELETPRWRRSRSGLPVRSRLPVYTRGMHERVKNIIYNLRITYTLLLGQINQLCQLYFFIYSRVSTCVNPTLPLYHAVKMNKHSVMQ